MPKRIYVGNMPGTTTSRQVSDLFSKYGVVTNVEIARDGTIYVEMSSGADEAIQALNKKPFDGTYLNVNEARIGR